MASGNGVFAQLMVAEEATYGTFVAGTRSLEFVNEGVEQKIVRIESKGLRAGRRVLGSGRWVPGQVQVGGPIVMEVNGVGFGVILKHMMGGFAITGGTGVFTHTATPGDLPVGLSVQIGRPDVTGVVNPFSYAGCRVNTWEMACKAGELLQLTLNLIGQSESTAQALGTFSEETGGCLLSYVGGLITCGGVEVDLLDFTFKGDNKLTERPRIRSAATTKQPLENNIRDYTGTLNADFEGLTQYNHFVNGDEIALSALFQGPVITGGSHFQLQLTANVRYDGTTPKVPGPEILPISLPVKAIGPTSDAGAITLAYQTSDAAA